MAQLPIAELGKDQKFEGFLLVRSADQRTGGNGAKYLDRNLTDRTGEVNAKVWDGNTPCPAPGSVISTPMWVLFAAPPQCQPRISHGSV